MTRLLPNLRLGHVHLALSALLLVGCGKSEDEAFLTPKDPKQTAAKLEQAFAQAPAPVRQNVTVASAALREGDYEKAVASLGTVRDTGTLTADQGLAVHHSMVSMEARIIEAMEAGDPRAKRAFEVLKRLKKK